MAVEKGDILMMEKSGSQGQDYDFAVALKDGDAWEVPVRDAGGNTFRPEETGDYSFIKSTDEKADVFISQVSDEIEAIATESLERDIAQEAAGEIFDQAMEKLADNASDVQTAAEQAVEQVLKNHPEVLDAITHPKMAEFVEFVAGVLQEAVLP